MLVGLLAAGCAAKGPRPRGAARRPALSPNAMMSLRDLGPEPRLAASRPVTASSAGPSLNALQLYAQARAALQSNERFTAIQLLEQALAMDPDAFELNLALGRAAAGTNLAAALSLPALHRAAAINPDNTEVHLLIARHLMQRPDLKGAINELRLAMQTSAYRGGGEAALPVDYLLARTLQQAGYDLAALAQYDILLDRLPQVGPMFRGSGEVMQMLQNPDVVLVEIAVLNGRLGRYPDALAAVEQAMMQSPQNQNYAMLRVRLLMQSGEGEQARQFLPEVIARFGAGVEVMSLMRDAFAPAGGEKAAIAALQKAMRSRPDSRETGFALADMLSGNNDPAGAEKVLASLASSSGYDMPTVARLFAYLESHDRTLDAARLLIEATARRSDDLSEISGMMGRLSRLSRSNHLRLRDLQQLRIESSAEAARLYWIARFADLWDRNELSRAALEKAVRIGRPFAPAYRALMEHYWVRSDWDEKRKTDTGGELVMLAQMQGSPALAAELRGMIALNRKQPREAATALLEAMRLGETAPEVQLGYAGVQLLDGNATEAERTLLKITEEFPLFESGYAALLKFYVDRGSIPSALRTLQHWINSDPKNASARLYQASVLILSKRPDAAEKVLLELFDENADNSEVLLAIGQLYQDTGRISQFVSMLEKKRQGRPDIREIAERLADIYASQNRMAEAGRVLDDLHRSAAGDSDLLYYVSHLYARIDDKKTSEAILEEVLKIDPNHSSAANDLGYCMADTGRELDRAEKLVRIALKEEPDNQAFLDSMGWVMYKVGRFADAKIYLQQAVAQTIRPDPIVVDHLADSLYRLGEREAAAARWKDADNGLRAMQMMGKEHNELGLKVQQKLRQLRQNQPVQVAPVVAPATTRAVVRTN